jgi:hypothetical protein
MEDSPKTYFLDNVRAFLVLLVIIMHVSLAYTPWSYVGWVHSAAPSVASVAVYISTIADNPILMAPIFFLAGYFTLASFAKKGYKKFVIDKLRRIGIPFAVGSTAIAYFLAIVSYLTSGGKGFTELSVPAIYKWLISTLVFFRPGFYTQYNFWFVGVLFWFYLITAFALKALKQKINPGITLTGKPSPLFFIGFILLCILVTFAVSLTGSFADWTVAYIISFQNIFIFVYAAYFLMGLYAYKRNWFTEGGYSPGIVPWAVIYAASMSAHVYLYLFKYQNNPQDIIPKLLISASYNISIMSWLFMLLAIFKKYFNKEGELQKLVSESTYTAYFIHLLLVFGMVILTNMMRMYGVARFVVNIILVPVFTWTIADDLKKIPWLRKIL